MNRDQVLQNLYRLQQHSIIFDRDIRIALGSAIIELSGEGKAGMPEKVQKVLDKVEADTKKIMQTAAGQGVLDTEG